MVKCYFDKGGFFMPEFSEVYFTDLRTNSKENLLKKLARITER